MSDGQQRPRLHVAVREGASYGDLAHQLAASYQLTQDPWQQLIQDDWLRLDEQGRWAHLTCGLSVPRQNGKNAVLEVRELFGMVGLGEKILHTAHQVKTAQKHFRRLKHFFGKKANDPAASFPELNALVREVRNVNGQEAIFLTNGGSIEIVARSTGSGRGFTVDVLVCDEAQDMSDEDQEALLSATSSAPLGNPQWIYLGTPPGPKVNGEVFSRVRTEALARKNPRRCWHEWSADPLADLDSHEVWRSVNPGLVTGRLLWDIIVGERGEMSDEGFARERLGRWSESRSHAVIDPVSWSEVADEASVAVDRLTLGVDVAPDQSMASIGVAGQRADGLWHVELVDQRPGTAWIVPLVVGILEKNPVRAVVIDGASPAAALLEAFKGEKVAPLTTGVRDMAAACQLLFTGVHESQLRHVGQPQLDAALNSAGKRLVMNGDGWAWSRRSSSSDITALVAATLALWGAQQIEAAPVRRRRGTGKVVVA